MAAACSTLEHIFEKPLQDNPTLLQSLSTWKQINSMKPIDITEIFGELRFNETSIHPQSSSSSLSSSSSFNSTNSTQSVIDGISIAQKNRYYPSNQRKHSDSFSSMNSESLSLCTEGLGFESSDDVEDISNNNQWNSREERRNYPRNHESKKLRMNREFPPPISSIGRSGKPWVCFKSYREDGRFILKEMRIPTQEFLQASREDGRLKLRFIHSESDDEIFEGGEDVDDEETIEENNGDDSNGKFECGKNEEKLEISGNCDEQGS